MNPMIQMQPGTYVSVCLTQARRETDISHLKHLEWVEWVHGDNLVFRHVSLVNYRIVCTVIQPGTAHDSFAELASHPQEHSISLFDW